MHRFNIFIMFFTVILISSQTECDTRRVQSISIKECLVMALANNLDLEIEGYNPEIVETQIIEARSTFDPVFTSSYTYGRSNTPSPPDGETWTKSGEGQFNVGIQKRFITGGTVGFNYSYGHNRTDTINDLGILNGERHRSASISLEITQPLLANMGISYNMSPIILGLNNKKISYYEFESKVITVMADVQKAYWELVYARDSLDVQKKSLGLSRQLREITQARIKAGALAAADILSAERDMSSKLDTLIVAEKNVKAAEDQLKKLIKPLDIDYYDNVDFIPVDRPAFVPININFEESLEMALHKRPEIAQSSLTISNWDITVAQKKNQLLPKLDISGKVFLSGVGPHTSEALRDIDRGEFFGWEAGLSLEIPIGNRAARSRYRRALLERKQAVASYYNIQNTIIIELRQVIRDLASAARRVETARTTRELAEKQLANEENKFRAGIITLYEVQQTEQDLTLARVSEIRAIVDYQNAMVELERVEASILDKLSQYNIYYKQK